MSSIHPGRMTHDHDGELVVFLIGMRVNRLWRPDVWGPAFAAMGPMLTELSSDPDSGLLGYHTMIGDRGPLLVQYWASVDKLYAYAADTEAAHRPAWTRFNQRVRKVPGVVGVWHETYVVASAESVYVGMPSFGLARATGLRAVTGRLDRARTRLEAASQAG
ncbi:MAG: DUF4188 domain-containing protein [Actinomycetota bacterium]|nr:DUF4188 domain-containing protein [Actinomycetota bacterium]